MSGLFEGFEPRVRRVYQLLRSSETAFVLVASPEEQVLDEAEYFCRRVHAMGMALRAVVFNRVHGELAGKRRDVRRADLEALLARFVSRPALVRELCRAAGPCPLGLRQPARPSRSRSMPNTFPLPRRFGSA